MAAREIHFRDELFEELMHNEKNVQETRDPHIINASFSPIPVLPSNYKARMEKIGTVMFSTNGGMAWLKTAFGDIIRKSVNITLTAETIPERISGAIEESRKNINEETSMFTFSILRWALKMRSLFDLINSGVDFVKKLMETASLVHRPQLTIPEQIVLFFISPDERKRVWEVFKAYSKDEIEQMLLGSARLLLSNVVP